MWSDESDSTFIISFNTSKTCEEQLLSLPFYCPKLNLREFEQLVWGLTFARGRVEIWYHLYQKWLLTFSNCSLTYSTFEQVLPLPPLWHLPGHRPSLDHWVQAMLIFIFSLCFLLQFFWVGCSFLRSFCFEVPAGSHLLREALLISWNSSVTLSYKAVF